MDGFDPSAERGWAASDQGHIKAESRPQKEPAFVS